MVFNNAVKVEIDIQKGNCKLCKTDLSKDPDGLNGYCSDCLPRVKEITLENNIRRKMKERGWKDWERVNLPVHISHLTRIAQTLASSKSEFDWRVDWRSERDRVGKMRLYFQTTEVICKHCEHTWQTKGSLQNVTCPSCLLKTPRVSIKKDAKKMLKR